MTLGCPLPEPGRSVVYYRGYLPRDRQAVEIGPHGAVGEISATAGLYWGLYEQGVGVLTQRRRGEFDYEYIFTRAREPRPPAARMPVARAA